MGSFTKKLKRSLNPIKATKAIIQNPKYFLNPVEHTKAIMNDPSSLFIPDLAGPAGAALANRQEAAKDAAGRGSGGKNAFGQLLQQLMGQMGGQRQAPFARASANLQPGFFQNPQAFAIISALLQNGLSGGGSRPTPWHGGLPDNQNGAVPGPPVTGPVKMGRVGGLGNGGGAMGMQNRWVRAL